MRFASFRVDGGGPTWGVLDGDLLYDLGRTGSALAGSLKEAIAAGLPDEHIAYEDAPTAGVDDVEFLPVIADPAKIICIGVNYKSHRDEIGKAAPEAPTVFIRFADSQTGHLCPVVMPKSTTQFDYEGELAVIIGAPARRVPVEQAHEYVAGFAVYSDFTARDWQRRTSQWTAGKNFPGTGAFGPWFVPRGQVADLEAQRIQTRVNGEVRQSATLGDLVFDIPSLIAYVTEFTSLEPGDVIVTGTPGGVGLFMDPPGLLQAGDVVEVEIDGVGLLSNTIVAE